MVKTPVWKKGFRKDIKNKFILMDNEYALFQETNNVGYLQQAGNKLFSIVENFLQLKYSHRVKSYGELKILVRNNKNDYKLLLNAVQLHYFFYNGEVQFPRDEAEFIFKEVHKRMVRRLKN